MKYKPLLVAALCSALLLQPVAASAQSQGQDGPFPDAQGGPPPGGFPPGGPPPGGFPPGGFPPGGPPPGGFPPGGPPPGAGPVGMKGPATLTAPADSKLLGTKWSDATKLPDFFSGNWQSVTSFLDRDVKTPLTPKAKAYAEIL